MAYLAAGWPAILPVPPESKTPPPAGYSGEHGQNTPGNILAAWIASTPGHSVALRMPEGVIGIDVDEYPKGQTVKRGAATLAEYTARWGPLPATWSSTARGPGPSRIYFYRAPAGRYRTKLGADVEIIQRHHRYAVVAPSWHHEVAAPYRWYDLYGQPAGLDLGPPRMAELAELPPAWAFGLREGAALAGHEPAEPSAGYRMLAALQSDLEQPCAEMYSAGLKALEQLAGADPGSRHDTMVPRVLHVVMLGAHGHPGAGATLFELEHRWEQLTAGEARQGEWERMVHTAARKAVTAVGQPGPVRGDPCMMLAGGIPTPVAPAIPSAIFQGSGQPNGQHAPEQLQAARAQQPPSGWPDTAPQVGGTPVAAAWGQPAVPVSAPNGSAPAAGSPPPPGGEPAATPSLGMLNPAAVLGTAPWDPQSALDQPLADDVIARMQPILRYAADSGDWLTRDHDRWRTGGDLSGWAVGYLARFMPQGDPAAEKGSPERNRAARRARLLSTAGRNAVAASMRDVVRRGDGPIGVRLAELDADPELLWAGGMPWDLRTGQLAPIDPGTPHLHTAACAPTPGPTPLWDAFLAAVWPDPEIRAWALRVLSVSLTGYPDATMPVMVGLFDRGKTQVVQLILSALGTYGIAANPKLLNSGDSSHDTIVYALKGARLAFIDEGPRAGHLAQERLKQLTGGGRLTGREVNKGEVRWEPTHTLVLTANDEPSLTDSALRKRVRLIPCDGDVAQIRAARRALGQTHEAAWRAELPGVLFQLMEQAGGWLADRDSALTEAAPLNIRGRAAELAAEQDPVRQWVEEDTEPWPAGTRSSDLYMGFVTWWKNTGRNPRMLPSTQKWGRDLTDLGYERSTARRDGQVAKYRPLRLRGPGGSGGHTAPQPLGQPVTASGVTDPEAPVTVPTPEQFMGGYRPAADGEQGQVTDVSDTYTDSGTTSGTVETPRSTTELEFGVTEVTDIFSIKGDNKITPIYTHIELTPVETGNGYSPPPAGQAEAPATKPPTATVTAKREAARAVKEAARLAAVRLAEGELIELPALVDRQTQSVTALRLDQALDVVRAEVALWGQLDVDVETTGYPVGHPEYALRTVQLGGARHAVVFDPDVPVQAEAVCELIADAPRLGAHSAPADLVPLDLAGLIDRDSAWDRMYDTVIPAKLGDPGSTGSDPSLKAVAPALLGPAAVTTAADAGREAVFKAGRWLTDVEPTTPATRSGWAMIDKRSTAMIRYAGADVLDTAAIGCVIPLPSPELHQRERAIQRSVVRIAHDGLRLDVEHVRALTASNRTDRDRFKAEIRSTWGVDNPGSSSQVATALAQQGARLPLTKGDRPSAAKAALEPLARAQGVPGAELADAVLRYRHHATALNLFLEPWSILADYAGADARVRSTIYTLQADTGRMSSVRFNLQQLSRRGGIRACLTADPGYALISADFSGVEIRTGAALSQDTNLIRLLANGLDMHSEIAKIVWGPEFTKSDRYTAKPMVFGDMYGAGLAAMASQGGTTDAVAQMVKDAISTLAPEYRDWAERVKQGVRRGHTEFQAYSGRVIHLDKRQPHKAPNYEIQGTARELMADALLRWSATRWGSCITVPIHDELLAMVPEGEAAEATAALVECMRTSLYGVPIEVEASAPAFAWQDAS